MDIILGFFFFPITTSNTIGSLYLKKDFFVVSVEK